VVVLVLLAVAAAVLVAVGLDLARLYRAGSQTAHVTTAVTTAK
jgi:hypothetical protein